MKTFFITKTLIETFARKLQSQNPALFSYSNGHILGICSHFPCENALSFGFSLIVKRSLIILLLFFSNIASAQSLLAITDTVPAPPLILKDTQGIKHDLQQYKGQMVLVQFWVSYCEPCITEMPSVNRLQTKLKQMNIPFKVLAVNLGESLPQVNAFLKTIKTDFTVLMDSEAIAAQNWTVYSAPKSFIIDTKGNVIYYVNGAIEWDSDEVIKQLTHKKS